MNLEYKTPINNKRKPKNKVQKDKNKSINRLQKLPKNSILLSSLKDISDFNKPFSLKLKLDEEPIYLPFFQQIDPYISKVLKCAVDTENIIFTNCLKSGQIKHMYTERTTSKTFSTTNYGKIQNFAYMLSYFANERDVSVLQNVDKNKNGDLKCIIQLAQENPKDELVQIISNLHPDFKGSIFTNFQYPITEIYDEQKINHIYLKNFFNQQNIEITTDYYGEKNKNMDVNSLKSQLVNLLMQKGRDIMDRKNNIIIQKYTVINNTNIQQNNLISHSKFHTNNVTNVHYIVKKLYNYFKDCLVYNNGKLYKYNEKNESFYGLWTVFEYKNFIEMIFSKEDEFKNILNEVEFEYLITNKKNVYVNLEGRMVKRCVEFDLYPHLIPLIDSKCSRVLDLNLNKIVEPEKHFYMQKHLDWSYSFNKSKTFRKELECFLNKIFPIKDIQDIVLAYIYKTLKGEKVKKFLLFTDNLRGNNGKSTFISFISNLFNSYTTSGKKYLIKSNVVFNSNNHDAGLSILKNKRFLTVPECSDKNHIDDEFVKEMADMVYMIKGRKFQSGEEFQFPMYANAILACNKNKFYKFDIYDYTFIQRMLVIEMQSIFDVNYDHDDFEKLHFKSEFLNPKFLLWKSAFIDILMEIGHKSDKILSKIDENVLLIKWRRNLVSLRMGINEDIVYDFKNWFDSNLIASEIPHEWVSCNDLKKIIKDSEFSGYFKSLNFLETFKTWLKEINVETIERHKFVINDNRYEKRNVIKNYKLK